MNIPDWLQRQAQTNGDRLSLYHDRRQWSFRELDQWVNGIAHDLQRQGIVAEDRIAILCKPSAIYVATIHAILRMGAIVVPLNSRLTPEELRPIIENARPKLLITELPWNPNDLKYRGKVLLAADLAAVFSDSFPQVTWDGQSLAAIIYTSGTTGHSKGVMLSKNNFLWSAISSGLHMGIVPADTWLHVMPLFHVGGLSILFRSVIHGSAIYLMSRFDAISVDSLFRSGTITLASLVPTMLYRLIALNPAPYIEGPRMILVGGSAASPDLINEAQRINLPIVSNYGLTETASQVVSSHPGSSHDGSSGRSLYPTHIAVLTEETVHSTPDRVGEILVQGPTVFQGYWNNPSATNKAFHQGWFRTGDMGWLDTTAHLHILDRRNDLIIRGGENIYPTEIENILVSHPAVREAAVVGMPDAEWGQQVAAVVVVQSPIDSGELRQFLSKHVASYKVPTVYYKIEFLPRTASGKIQRHLLRASYQTLENL